MMRSYLKVVGLKMKLKFIYWIKWAIVYIAIRIYNALQSKRRRFDLYDIRATGDPFKLGFLTPHLEKELESPCPESHLQEAADEVLFYGVNSSRNACWCA
ncbi:phosphoenolpyruvate synthase [Caerostris extrusa]|uniref:Phosphoenolpyruvate synthase n=1 Tax=Caerostris extrusa TaxID=172846 RepID=A0AAV4U9F4_CAEEX|nr:phosphoenolpyruvate synthase [Caerostris extrusa]